MAAGRHRGRRALTQRALQHDLQGARDALIAFDGFEPAVSPVPAAVLQRPSDAPRQAWPQWLAWMRNLWSSMRQR